jgi:hypothetical protein
MANNGLEMFNAIALFTVGLVGGHAVISMMTNNKEEMATEEQPNPTDAESMMYEDTEAKVIIPYSLYEGGQGALYRDYVWEGQDHFPFDGEMYSRPALTTLMYDSAFGSSPSRTIDLPYRIHENEPVSLPSLTVAGSYAMGSPTTLEHYGSESFAANGADECPQGMKWDASRKICVPPEQPMHDYGAESFRSQATPQMQLGDKIEGSQNALNEVSTSAWVGDNWKKVGYHPEAANYPLIRPRTNNPVVSDMIDEVSSIRMPPAQHLSVGRDSIRMYDPYTFMEENPNVNVQYRPTETEFGDGAETKTSREWQTSNTIFDYSDQQIETQSKFGGFRQRLRRV